MKYHKSIDVNVTSERFQSTLAKLDQFKSLQQGWDLGHGDPISPESIIAAKKLVDEIYPQLWRTSVFPSPYGSVLVAFLVDDRVDIEVSVDPSGTFDVRCEVDRKEVFEQCEVSLGQAIQSVLECARKHAPNICSSVSLTIPYITIKNADVIGAPHLSLRLTAAYPGLIYRAAKNVRAQFVPTSRSTMPRSAALRPATGSWSNFQPTLAWQTSERTEMTLAT